MDHIYLRGLTCLRYHRDLIAYCRSIGENTDDLERSARTLEQLVLRFDPTSEESIPESLATSGPTH